MSARRHFRSSAKRAPFRHSERSLRSEESLFSWVSVEEGFLDYATRRARKRRGRENRVALLGMTAKRGTRKAGGCRGQRIVRTRGAGILRPYTSKRNPGNRSEDRPLHKRPQDPGKKSNLGHPPVPPSARRAEIGGRVLTDIDYATKS